MQLKCRNTFCGLCLAFMIYTACWLEVASLDYMCVCVCVSVCKRKREKELWRKWLGLVETQWYCVPVAQWKSIALAAQKVVVQFPGNTHTDKKCITWMHCKSLWIIASAKCINVNVVKEDINVNPKCAEEAYSYHTDSKGLLTLSCLYIGV